jgi:hypothetical protein
MSNADQSPATAPLTRKHVVALQLLARGGARYGTMYAQMAELRDMGLCQAHQTPGKTVGQWTWRPTDAGRALIAEKGIVKNG